MLKSKSKPERLFEAQLLCAWLRDQLAPEGWRYQVQNPKENQRIKNFDEAQVKRR